MSKLRPEEHAAIISVIQRNEEVEHAERQRVERLVDRVEKIRLHTIDAGPNSCHLCGETFRLLSRKITCEDCKRMACTKCSFDINVRYHTIDKTRIMWLCRMCSETREMWKKTGAWFYKGLPKYEMHAKANNAHNESKINNKLNNTQKKKELVREKRIKKLTIHVKDSSSSSSSENETTEPGAYKVKETRSSLGEINMQRGESFRLRTLDKLRGFINGRERKLSNAFSLGRQSLRGDNDADVASLQSRAENSISRCGSVSSFWSNSDSSVTNSSGIVGKANNNTTTNKAETVLPRDPLLGWLELSINYRKDVSILEVTVIRAFDLTPMDADGLTDAFCQVNILHVNENSGAKYTRWQRTKTVHKTRNPAFNETLQLTQLQGAELSKLLLYICLYDDDKYGYDFLGAVKISLETILQNNPQRVSVPLGLEDYYSKQAWTAHEWPRAELHIALSYNTKRRALLVHINQCVNLIPMDNNGSSDPFVKLQYKHKKYKTGVKWRTLNPVFNEEFCFETSPHDLDKEVLTITVWDMDLAKSNDFLGSLVLGHCSKGARLQQWLSCIRRPDHFHDRWHCLSYEMPSAAERAKRYTSHQKLVK